MIGVVVLFAVLCAAPYFYPLSRYDASLFHPPHDNGCLRQFSGINIYSRIWEPSCVARGNVLLVHGFGSSTYAWEKIMPCLLAAGFRVVAVDVPGLGYSDKNITWPYSHDKNAEVLWALADLFTKDRGLSGDAKWFLVGHSIGGEIVLRMAAQRPEKVKRVVLAAGAISGGKPHSLTLIRFPPARRWAMVLIEILLRRSNVMSGILGSAYGRPPTSEELKGYTAPLYVDGTIHASFNIGDSHVGLNSTVDMLKNLPLPVSLIWGENDKWIPTRQGRRIANLIGRPLLLIPGAGHCPMETHPAEFARVILNEMTGNGTGYAAVVSRKTADDHGWKDVADALVNKYNAALLVYDASPEEVLPRLRQDFPKYVCFVAQPAEAGRDFVRQVHCLMRKLDDDPYTDCFWGILTGYDASNALRIATCREPLVVRKVAGGTSFNLDRCEEGIWYSESRQGMMMKKEKGGRPSEFKAPGDTTEELVKCLTEYKADAFITSGHATERDWQIGYSFRGGSFRCDNGILTGYDTHGGKHPVHSPNPKVYLPIGNCLMGHIDSSNAMALAFLNSGGMNQMIGYTVPTWYGYAGWGCLDYFIEQPGRYTFTEAFFANHAALVHRLQVYFPELAGADSSGEGSIDPPKPGEKAVRDGLQAQDGAGLLYDRDTVAFYGDPAWQARMAEREKAWEQKLSEKDGIYTFEIIPRRSDKSFEPADLNGSQRGRRPVVEFLPHRVKNVKILHGADLAPVVTDNFILVPNPSSYNAGRDFTVKFSAERM